MNKTEVVAREKELRDKNNYFIIFISKEPAIKILVRKKDETLDRIDLPISLAVKCIEKLIEVRHCDGAWFDGVKFSGTWYEVSALMFFADFFSNKDEEFRFWLKGQVRDGVFKWIKTVFIQLNQV
jgi:hypothetical protein